MDNKTTHRDAPGIYLVKNRNPGFGEDNFGLFSAWHSGALSGKASNEDWTVFFEGILFRDYTSPKSDSEFILDTFSRSENIQDVLGIQGFYNLIIIHNSGSKGFLVSDPLCSRPQYLYQKSSMFASAPTPLMFSEHGLDISLNSMHALEIFRFLHNGYDRTLANEISRHLPGKYYTFDQTGKLKVVPYTNFSQNVNNDITEDEATDWMYETCKTPMEAAFSHPRLKDLEVHLPLTSGLDSRHLLGQSIASGKPPTQLWHVIINPKDHSPVKKISQELNIPLYSPSVFELDFRKLIKRWLERSAGLVNVHQFYLLNAPENTHKHGSVGFNGQLMDKFLGQAPVTNIKKGKGSLAEQRWTKSYSGKTIMKGLFEDYDTLDTSLFSIHSDFINSIEGEDWYKIAIYEFYHKSLHYTGITDTMLSDKHFSFSPGASLESLNFVKSVPFSIGGKKKIRLKALQKYFPEIGRFPDEDGIPLIEKKQRPRTSKSPFQKNALPYLKWFLGGFRGDPAPNTEHEWLRKSPLLNKIHKKIVFDGLMIKDGFLNANTAKMSWYIHQAGGFQAWTLMSLLTIEMAYRVLCKHQSVDESINWLFD